MIVSAVLLPNAADSEQLIKYSQAINRSAASLIELSEGALPHITVAQFVAPAEAVSELWEVSKKLHSDNLGLTSAGLSLIPGFDHNQLWVELQFLKSNALSRLQEAILQSDFASRYDLHSGGSDLYRPHCTLALLEGFRLPSLELGDPTIFKRQYEKLKLAVGVNGEYFTFPEAEFTQP